MKWWEEKRSKYRTLGTINMQQQRKRSHYRELSRREEQGKEITVEGKGACFRFQGRSTFTNDSMLETLQETKGGLKRNHWVWLLGRIPINLAKVDLLTWERENQVVVDWVWSCLPLRYTLCAGRVGREDGTNTRLDKPLFHLISVVFSLDSQQQKLKGPKLAKEEMTHIKRRRQCLLPI